MGCGWLKMAWWAGLKTFGLLGLPVQLWFFQEFKYWGSKSDWNNLGFIDLLPETMIGFFRLRFSDSGSDFSGWGFLFEVICLAIVAMISLPLIENCYHPFIRFN